MRLLSSLPVAGVLLVVAASSAAAVTPVTADLTFNLKSTSDSNSTGASGNSTGQLSSSNGAWTGITVNATAWNANVATSGANAGQYVISSAYLGKYQYGLGVTSSYDNPAATSLVYNGQTYSNYDCASGDCGTHQIDNAGNAKNSSSIDFVMLTFSKAVTLSGIGTYAFGMLSNATTSTFKYDDDFSYGHVAASTIYNGAVFSDLSQLFGTYGSVVNGASVNRTACESATSGVCGDSWTAGINDTAAKTASTTWLVAASVLANYGGDSKIDGFKLSTINVIASVPEASTWAMMVMGFGMIGHAMRRRKTDAAAIV